MAQRHAKLFWDGPGDLGSVLGGLGSVLGGSWEVLRVSWEGPGGPGRVLGYLGVYGPPSPSQTVFEFCDSVPALEATLALTYIF